MTELTHEAIRRRLAAIEKDPPQVKVLAVDDMQENLFSLKKSLAAIDCEVVCVNSGNDALAALLDDEFACVLLDVQMPGIDGFEVARLITEDPELENLPIVFVTAYNKDERDVIQGYKLGSIDYLTKPFEPVILRSKVKVFCDLYRQRKTIELQKEQLDLLLEDTISELIKTNEDLGNYAALASHDLRAPIANIKLIVLDVLGEEGDKLSKDNFNWLSKVPVVADRLLNITKDLLALCSIGKDQLEIDSHDLGKVIESSLESIALENRNQVDLEQVDEGTMITGTSSLLELVFQNLISNAFKYSDKEDTRVRIVTTTKHDHVLVSVEDNGSGIRKEYLPFLFEPFKRFSKGTKGSGVGLTICKRVMNLFGGSIEADSILGEGTIFRLKFPKVGD